MFTGALRAFPYVQKRRSGKARLPCRFDWLRFAGEHTSYTFMGYMKGRSAPASASPITSPSAISSCRKSSVVETVALQLAGIELFVDGGRAQV